MSDDGDEDSPYAGLAKRIRGGDSASMKAFENALPELYILRKGKDYTWLMLFGVIWYAIAALCSLVTRTNGSSFRVLVDGESLATLGDYGQRTKVTVTPGKHILQVVSKNCQSPELKIEVKNTQKKYFVCTTNRVSIVLRPRR